MNGGIGAWYDELEKQKTELLISSKKVDIKWLKKLKIYGYPIEKTDILDKQTKVVVTAFQMHFRPSIFLVFQIKKPVPY